MVAIKLRPLLFLVPSSLLFFEVSPKALWLVFVTVVILAVSIPTLEAYRAASLTNTHQVIKFHPAFVCHLKRYRFV
jgi:hypothetical protein